MTGNQLSIFDPVLSLVAINLSGREATLEEATIIDAAWANAESSIRAMAWLSREGKTWKHLTAKDGEAFGSFEQYGKERFGYEKAYLSQLCTAYETQKSLKFAVANKELPERQLRELSKTDDIELRNQIYAEVQAENETVTAKLIKEKTDEIARIKMALDVSQQSVLDANNSIAEQRSFALASDKARRAISNELADLKSQPAPAPTVVYVTQDEDYRRESEKVMAEMKEKIARESKLREKAISEGVHNELLKLATSIEADKKRLETIEQTYRATIEKTKQLQSKNEGELEHRIALTAFVNAVGSMKAAAETFTKHTQCTTETLELWHSTIYGGYELFTGLCEKFELFETQIRIENQNNSI